MACAEILVLLRAGADGACVGIFETAVLHQFTNLHVRAPGDATALRVTELGHVIRFESQCFQDHRAGAAHRLVWAPHFLSCGAIEGSPCVGHRRLLRDEVSERLHFRVPVLPA